MNQISGQLKQLDGDERDDVDRLAIRVLAAAAALSAGRGVVKDVHGSLAVHWLLRNDRVPNDVDVALADGKKDCTPLADHLRLLGFTVNQTRSCTLQAGIMLHTLRLEIVGCDESVDVDVIEYEKPFMNDGTVVVTLTGTKTELSGSNVSSIYNVFVSNVDSPIL